MIQALRTLVSRRFSNLIESLENLQTPFSYYVVTFVAIVVLRDFVEDFSAHATPDVPAIFIHFFLSYTALSAALIVILQALTDVDVRRVSRVVMVSFALIWLAPVLDILIGGLNVFAPAYITESQHLLTDYFTYFGPLVKSGVTPGMRIEIGCAILLALGYTLLKTKSMGKGIVSVFLTYTIIFAYIAMPAILTRLGIHPELTPLFLPKFYFLLTVAQILYLLYRLYPGPFLTMVRDVRPLRLFHYQFMFVFGVCLAVYYGYADLSQLSIPVLDLILIFFSITFAWLYSIVTNNLEDIEIDAITNPNRVTITKSIDGKTYQQIGWLLLTLATLCALLINFSYTFMLWLFIGIYFIYSMPPLRLKRFFLVSKFLLGLNALVLAIAGYMYVTGNSIHEFPIAFIPFFLVGMTLALNFIDIKDYAGDKQAGIQTMSVLFGQKKAKQVIGVSFMLCYLMLFYIIGDSRLLLPLLFGGAVQFYFVNKKHYQEWLILVTHLVSLLGACIYFLSN